MVSYFSMPVNAGFPSPALDYLEQRINLQEEYVRDELSTFIINSVGDSMVDAFIPPKARLVVDRSRTAKNGDIVLAVLNGEFLVKFLKKNDFKCWLVAANRKYPDIEISGDLELIVWGVVTAVIFDTKDVRSAMI